MNKTYLFIDGSNLYAAQYELFGPFKYLHFPSFIGEINSKLNIKFDKILFYASYSPRSKNPTKKELLYLKNEFLFYASVKETKNATFFKGYRSKSSGKEKEVDVKLSVDLVDLAYKNEYQSIYLLTGDADFLQALFAIKHLNKKISVISMQNHILYRAPFFFHTFIIKTNSKAIIKFKKFQKYSFVNIKTQKLLKRV
ncbi:MAG: NYN domain-containing protein [Patescibacteria group bacterium]